MKVQIDMNVLTQDMGFFVVQMNDTKIDSQEPFVCSGVGWGFHTVLRQLSPLPIFLFSRSYHFDDGIIAIK